MTEPGTASRPPLLILIGVFITSACVLALEVTLTRIFSAVLMYHFVFLVISVAVCGLGVGGMLVYSAPRLRATTLAGASSSFGLSTVAFLIVLIKLILPSKPEWLWLIALLIVIPFVFAGMFLAIAFRTYPLWSGTIYAWDLFGAGFASLGVVGCMQLIGPLNTSLAIAFAAVIVGLLEPRGRLRTSVLVAVTAGIVISSFLLPWLDIPPLPTTDTTYVKQLYSRLAQGIGSRIIHSEWDAFARTDVVEDPQAGPDALVFYTNGDVPTNLVRYDRKNNQFALQPEITDVIFSWQPPRRVLCIGPGAGMDLILAKTAGATSVDGVEINPSIPRILRLPRFQKFGGNPYGLRGVQVVVGDGRTYVQRSRKKYDLIFAALTKTATGTTGIALVEGYIYTLEAFRDYWDHLASDGRLVFVTDTYENMIRLLLTELRLLREMNKSLDLAMDHIALMTLPQNLVEYSPYCYALILSKRTISRTDAHRLFRLTVHEGYRPRFVPGIYEGVPFNLMRAPGGTIEDFATTIAEELQKERSEGMKPERAAGMQVLNLLPVTDDSPFFSDLSHGVPPMLIPLFAMTIAIVSIFSIGVIAQRAFSGRVFGLSEAIRNVLYFSCLGVGFMLIEIPLVQKLILILGHPTHALTVVLFALLLGSGAGSAYSQRLSLQSLDSRCGLACIIVAVLILGASIYFSMPQRSVLMMPLAGRMVWSGAISALLGFAMGLPFPLGIRMLGRHRPDDIPWMWGVNGITSVLGSLLAATGAKLIGFRLVFMTGALIYLLAALVIQSRNQAGTLRNGDG